MPPTPTAQLLAAVWITQLQARPLNYKELFQEMTQVGGQTALHASRTEQTAKAPRQVGTEVSALERGGRLFEFTCTSLPPGHDAHEAEFQTPIASVLRNH